MAIATLFGEEESGDQGVVGLLGEKIHQNKLSYLQLINKFSDCEWIVPSVYRQLTEEGKKIVDAYEGDLSSKLERNLRVVQFGRLLNPEMSSMDAFVYELGDVLWHGVEGLKDDLKALNKPEINPAFTYLAAIDIVHRGIEAGLLELNPKGSPNDACYLKYLGN